MYAIVEISGKQYKVEKDITLHVDKIKDQKEGDIKLDKVLMFVDGEKIALGKPYLSNVKISAQVLRVVKGKKVRGIKFRRRKNYTRTFGQRPEYLELKISEVALV